LVFGGPPTELGSWGRAFGRVNLNADVDLGRIRQIVPDGTLPFEEMAGRLKVTLGISRRVAGAMPEATLSARTNGFQLSRTGIPLEPSDGTQVRSPARWRMSGMDFDLDAATDEDGDEATLHGRVRDEHGTLLDVTFGSPFPPPAILEDPATGKKSDGNLEGAAQMIEILGLLEQKTRGNLTAEERQVLEQILYELRMRFVEASGQTSRIIHP